jgi:hypothetical protein
MWRIYYDDGSVFSSEDGDPWDAPRTGVEVIVHPDGNGLSMMSQSDYYVYEPERAGQWGGWNYTDHFGLVLYLQRAKKPLVLFGAMVLDSQFSEIEKRALADIRGAKQSWRRGQDKQNIGQTSQEPLL